MIIAASTVRAAVYHQKAIELVETLLVDRGFDPDKPPAAIEVDPVMMLAIAYYHLAKRVTAPGD